MKKSTKKFYFLCVQTGTLTEYEPHNSNYAQYALNLTPEKKIEVEERLNKYTDYKLSIDLENIKPIEGEETKLLKELYDFIRPLKVLGMKSDIIPRL